ncbi:MAG: plasmid stabilization protein [Deltaproteobacteria bacterium RIFCSPLOWO2_02_FULL_53_8]|nr:MAG: plasmid stabilization protein [Deltaproteobacteria bacterium RIFCSPLOWO2_02_FULL_53_8]
MARKVIWSKEAVDDIDSLAEYIARDSSYYAAAFVNDVIEISRSLDRFSERGRIVPEFGDRGIRELIVKEYRLIYCIEETRVVILGVIHGKRDLQILRNKIKEN